MSQTDRELLDAHRSGDTAAFGELFTRHRDRLWAVALRTTGNPEDAADALQDALISAYERAGSFRGDAQVSTWLHRVVVNAALDRLRRNKVRLASPITDDMDFASPAPGPLDQAEAGSMREIVLAALEQLPPDQKAALVLVDMEHSQLVRRSDVLYKCGWSPLEGDTLRSTIVATVVNGELKYREGEFFGAASGRRLEFERH